jgi:hypothetical protein
VKKATSIAMVLLILAAMLHVSVATHYCGGQIADSRVTFTGKLASCGMESPEKGLPFPVESFSKHCCDDVITICETDSNYMPSFSFVPESNKHDLQILSVLTGLSFDSCPDLVSFYTNVSPPGVLMSTDVDLSNICVFRI